ncbi:MAG TPA: uracil-DNA glycosylase family protein [Gammaproteobacteria bacterium]|nr:uracil-DNA glycosylase family protein [Gammaproteobacteria bacterium]
MERKSNVRVRSERDTAALVAISRRLAERVERLRFAPPVCCTYNPLVYAREPHERYLMRYGAAPKEVLLVGMNPGPFGMVQTGVPFGDVAMVRDWLGIEGTVLRPRNEHPKRPVRGFACERSEVSGSRLWGWARARFGTPEKFFARFFVANYCPLAFVEDTGRNRTPDKLPAAEREALFAICDAALREVVDYFSPRLVVGVGGFAERRARESLAGLGCAVGAILHPSPANPLANRGWAEIIEGQLAALGVELEP